MIRTTITLDTASARRLDENGYLHVASSHISKETVNPYYGREVPGWEALELDPERIYQVYRPGEELARGADTFNGLPLHLEHHVDSAENPQKEHRVGSLGTDAAFNAPYLDNSLTITDWAAIVGLDPEKYGETEEEKKRPKIKELSAAYIYDPVVEAGTFDGQPYDIIMTNIRGNHVALVEEGRAGPDVVVADQQIETEKKGLLMSIWEKFKKLIAEAEAAGIKPHPDGEKEAETAVGDNEGGAADPDKKAQDDQAEEMGVKLFALIDAIDDKELADKIKAGIQEMRAEKAEGATDNDPAPSLETMDDDPSVFLAKLAEAFKGLQPDDIYAFQRGMGEMADKEKFKEIAGRIQSAMNGTSVSPTPAAGNATDEGAGEGGKEEAAMAAMDRKLRKVAQDAALIKAHAVHEVEARFKAKTEAAQKVRPLVGEVDIWAFDSAGDIYRYALTQSGLKPSTKDSAALKDMVSLAVSGKGAALAGLGSPTLAQDSKPLPDSGPLAGLNRIKLSR